MIKRQSKKMKQWLISFLAAAVIVTGIPFQGDEAPTAKAAGDLNVPITVKESAGVAANGFPVSVVVPLPYGEYQDTASFRMVDGVGNTVDAQFEVLNRHWAKDNSIRHVQVHFQPTVAANGSAQYYLRDDGSGDTGGSLTVDDTGNEIEVDTGAVQFSISKTGFNLFNSVTYGGQQIISPSNENGGVLTDRFGDPQYDAQMDAPTVTLEEDGPMRAVIRLELPAKFRLTDPNLQPGIHDLTEPLEEGEYTHDHGYIVRIYAYANQSFVQVDYSLANSDMSVLSAWPLYFEDFSLSFQLPSSWNDVKIGGQSAHVESTVGTGKYIYTYDDTTVANEPAYVIKEGPGVDIQADATLQSGYRAPGWIDLSGSDKGMMVAMKHFWQMWPAGLEVDGGKRLNARLFPKWGHGYYWTIVDSRGVFNAAQEHLHWLEDMQVITKNMMFYFHDKETSAELNDMSRLFERPPLGVVPVDWYEETGVTLNKGGTMPEENLTSATLSEGVVMDMSHHYYDLGYMNYNGYGHRRRSGTAGNIAPSRGEYFVTGNPDFYYYAEDVILYGSLNTRPTWLTNYTYENGSIYVPSLNKNFHPVNSTPEGARSWRVWWPQNGDLNGKNVAPHLDGTAFVGWTAYDYQHLWTYEVEDFYHHSGNKLIYDWYKGIGEMMKTDILGTESTIYEFANSAGAYGTRGKGHLLATLMQAYRVVGDPSYLEAAHKMVTMLADRQFKWGGFDSHNESSFTMGYLAGAVIDFLEEVKGHDPQAYVDGFGVLQGIIEFNHLYNRYGYYIHPVENGGDAYVNPNGSNGTSSTIIDPEVWWYWHTGDEDVYNSIKSYIAGEYGSMPLEFEPVWRGKTVGRLAADLFNRYDQAKSDTEPPVAVSDLTAASLGGGQVELNWTGPSDAVDYHVRWATRPISPEHTQDEGRINWWKAKGAGHTLTGGGAKSLTISDMPDDAILYFAVVSFDGEGNMSEVSNVATAVTGTGDVTAPGAITNLAATALTGESVELAWTTKGDDGDTGTAALEYDIRYSTAPITEQNWDGATPVDDVPAPRDAGKTQRMTAIGLAPNTTHYFAMKATDDAGNVSGLSNVAEVTTGEADPMPPAAMQLSNETASQTSVVLKWHAPGGDGNTGTAHRYDIRYSTAPIATESDWNNAVQVDGEPEPKAAGTMQQMKIEDLEPATMYYFAVKAYDQANQASALSNVVQVATRPENVALNKPVTQNGVHFSVSDNQPTFTLTDGHYWYEGASSDYYIKLRSGLVSMQVDLGEQQPVAAISLLHRANSSYRFRDVIVQLSNDPSFATGVTTVYNNDANGDAGQGVGTDPEYYEKRNGKNFILDEPVSARYVRVWSRGSNVESLNNYTELQVYTEAPLAEAPDAPTGLTATPGELQMSLAWTAPAGAETFDIQRRTGTSGSFSTIATSVMTTSYIDTGLGYGETYQYRVAAANAGGEGDFSEIASGVPLYTQVPEIPTGLVAIAGDSRIELDWAAPFGADSYNVKRSEASGGPYTTIATGVTASAYTDTTVTNGTAYYYVVSAVNMNGESADSGEASAIPAPPMPPAAPSGLALTPGDHEVVLQWSASAGATGYNVKRSTANGGPYTTIASNVAATTFTDTGLTNGTTYYYVVSAVNPYGESANSVEASTTPLSDGIPLDRTGWIATASNSSNVNLALDGVAGNRWTGYGQSVGDFYQVNMRAPYTFHAIELDSGNWPNDYPEGYEVFVSNDGSTWTSVATGSGTRRYTKISFPAQTAQYIKVVLTVNDGSWWSIDEFHVFAPAILDVPTGLTPTAGDGEVALEWTATANATGYNVKRGTMSGGPYVTIAPSVTEATYTDLDVLNGTTYYYVVSAVYANGEGADSPEVSATPVAAVDTPLDRTGWTAGASYPYSTANAFDGNISTRWSTQGTQQPGKYYQLNLGAAQTFNKIVLDSGSAWPNDYPEGYEAFVSHDGNAWTSVATGSGSSRITTITFPEQTAQHIRIELTASDGSWWSIAELNVFH